MPRVKKYSCVEQEEAITRLIKKQLIDKGWSVGHFAKLCGKTASQLSREINHPLHIKVSTLFLMADKLGIKEIPL